MLSVSKRLYNKHSPTSPNFMIIGRGAGGTAQLSSTGRATGHSTPGLSTQHGSSDLKRFVITGQYPF